jgi:methylmalonyl-CoA mutase
MTTMSLAAGFPEFTRADWRQRVEAVLKGTSVEERLVTTTPDGIRIEPLYGQVDGPRAARAHQTPWTVFQRVDHPDPAKANAQALDDLANGATGLALVSPDAPSARGHSVDPASFARILQGVHLHAISLRVEGQGAMALADLIAGQPIDPERMNASFSFINTRQAQELARRGFQGPFAEADGRIAHDRGATDVIELGTTLAQAVGLLRQFDQLNDLHLVKAVGATLVATQDMFATLAKFRAMRLLWRRVLDAAGLPDAPLRLHAETSWRMMAESDPHTNILRSTAAVFGAGLGGADSICVLPHSIRQGLPNAFARRIARNVQTVLLEESNLWRVADPASGSGYIETLTDELCKAAWRVFQDAEQGKWPTSPQDSRHALPIIGTAAYRLDAEYPADVEALS